MKDEKLHFFCRNFAEESLNILNSSNVKMPMIDVEKVKFRENGSGYETKSEQIPDKFLLIFQFYDRIANSPAFKSFTNYMLENERMKKLYTNYEVMRSIPTAFLEKFLFQKRRLVGNFNEQRFNKVYESFETYLYSKTVPYRSFIIVSNLEIETAELAIHKNLKIKPLSEREFEELINALLLPFSSPTLDFLSPKNLVLEIVYEIRKNPDVVINSPTRDQTKETRKIFDNFITALRLFKKGGVGFNAIFGQNLSDWEGSGFRISSSPASHYFSGTLKLLESEEDTFKTFWNFFKGINFESFDKNFRIATNRFNSAYERKDPEDRLIDHVIALTSLFSRKDESGLGRHRLSMRIALLLERQSSKRKKIRQELLEIYDKRSAVVHGGEIKKFKNFRDMKDLVDTAEEYVRRSLKVLLELDLKLGGRSKVIDSIENGLLSAPIDFESDRA